MAKEVDSIHLLSCAIEASLGNDFPAFAFRGRGLGGKVTGSSTKLTSAPAPLRGAAAAAAEGP